MELGDTGQVFEVQPHGWRFYGLWLRSPDYELMLGRNEKFPAAVAHLHSAYLHSMGVWPTVRLVESTLRRAVLVGPGEVCVPRIDPYADVQHVEGSDAASASSGTPCARSSVVPWWRASRRRPTQSSSVMHVLC